MFINIGYVYKLMFINIISLTFFVFLPIIVAESELPLPTIILCLFRFVTSNRHKQVWRLLFPEQQHFTSIWMSRAVRILCQCL